MRIAKSLFIIFLLVAYGAADAQDTAKQALMQELYQLQKKYSNNPGLSLDLKYTYSGERRPGVILDSLAGGIAFFENGYKLKIDHTETIKNDKYVIVLFGEDSIMYVSASKPTSIDALNVTAIIDSSILNAADASYDIYSKDNLKHLEIRYRGESPYKMICYIVNEHSGLLEKTVMVVKTELLTASNGLPVDLQGYDEYSIVETSFFNYQTDDKKVAAIDEQAFFTKSGKTFLPTAQYRNYKIFIGTPNL